MPPRPRPKSPTATSSPSVLADHRARLVALRDKLTADLDDAPVAYTAAIARQLQAVLNELATMSDPDAPPSSLAELQGRARTRLAAEGRTPPPSRLGRT